MWRLKCLSALNARPDESVIPPTLCVHKVELLLEWPNHPLNAPRRITALPVIIACSTVITKIATSPVLKDVYQVDCIVAHLHCGTFRVTESGMYGKKDSERGIERRDGCPMVKRWYRLRLYFLLPKFCASSREVVSIKENELDANIFSMNGHTCSADTR